MKEIIADKLKVRIYQNRNQMGSEAAKMAASDIARLLAEKDEVNIIFAAAASQNEFLEALLKEDVDWARVNAFHMDEYIGLQEGAPQSFGVFLKNRIFDKAPFKHVYLLQGHVADIEAECKRYMALLEQYPVDITFMGIGENTHLAFNDPHVANFDDTYLVKVVDLDEACKQQQVNEDCFDDIAEVPPYALTLTIPALLKAEYIFCIVPGTSKAQAVYHTIMDGISEQYPSTILRKHSNAVLFLERESAALILDEASTPERINYN
jgi:glucosamine-6-phosphate deaminase